MKYKIGDRVRYDASFSTGEGIIKHIGNYSHILITKIYYQKKEEALIVNRKYYFLYDEIILIDTFPDILEKAKEIRKLGDKLLKI